MAKLCQDNAQVELCRSWGELKMLMNIALAAPESHPNLFKGYSGTAGAFIASLKGRQQEFCRRNYHIASFDARVASLKYTKQSLARREEKARKWRHIADVMARVYKKWERRDRNYDPEEQLMLDCVDATLNDSAATGECYWDRKKYIRPPSDAERAADLINATVQRRSR